MIKLRQVYKITNLINGKIYIGKDSSCRKNYYGSGVAIINAIKKYGKENFTKEILEEGEWSLNFLNEKEIYWIEKYKSYNYKIGYNRSKGGDGFNNFKEMNSESYKIGLKKRKKYYKSIEFSELKSKHTTEYFKDINNRIKQSNILKKYWKTLSNIEKVKKIEKLKKQSKEYWENIEKSEKRRKNLSDNWKNNNPMFNEEIKEKMKKTQYNTIQKNCIKIEIEGIIYEKMQYAIDKLGITRNSLVKRLKSKNYPNYKRINK